MKKILKDNMLLGVLIFIFSVSACRQPTADKGVKSEYTCPMHPEIIRDAPGICPICKMDLVSKHTDPVAINFTDSMLALMRPTDEFIIADVKTVSPEQGSRKGQIKVSGTITYNPNARTAVSTRTAGRIERLYVKYNFQAVSKGQKIMDLYSPDLVNAQQELLFLKNASEPELVQAARKKLLLMGMTDRQITATLNSGKIQQTVSIYSPASGFISETNAEAQSPQLRGGTTIISSSSSMSGMESANPVSSAASSSLPNTDNRPIGIKQGQYLNAGQRLFDLINTNTVWAEFFPDPNLLAHFARGKSIRIESSDVENKSVASQVSLVQPYFKDGISYSVVRATIPNANLQWKVGELLSVIPGESRTSGTWIPKTAVLDLGGRKVVFVKQNLSFKPVEVQVLSDSGNSLNIGNSLRTNQQIAENAWFLIDSESFVKIKNTKE